MSTMPDTLRQQFILHAQLRTFQNRVSDAYETVREALTHMQCPYVAFSGGKDSTVVLQIVRDIAPDVPAVWGDEEYNLPETHDLVDATPNVIKVALPDYHADCFFAWQHGNVPEGTILIDKSKYTEFDYHRRLLGFDGAFLGLRKQESIARRKVLGRLGNSRFCATHGLWECNPIASWRTEDVWAFIVSRDVPYNAAYNKLMHFGLPIHLQRVGPIVVERISGFGQLRITKQLWPDLYQRFIAAHPEAIHYA